MDPFIGEIRLLPYTFAPQGWALCNGQLLAIQTATALFSVIGVTYGGDGKTNFALPNLQGRVVPGVGHGPGLQNWNWGMTEGEDAVTLLQSEMPQHNHIISGLDTLGSAHTPANDTVLAQDRRGNQGIVRYLSAGGSLDTNMGAQAMDVTGADQAHENRQPFLSMNFCIALDGIFPVRS